MESLIKRAYSAVARRWKYRFRPSRYKAFLGLCEGRGAPQLDYFPEQRAIVDEVLRLRAKAPPPGRGQAVDAISVVIPHYNQQRYLGAAIESVRNQSFAAAEVVVVDDLSDDIEAVRAVEGTFRSDPRVRFVYSSRKLYAGGARQLGLESTSGDAVSFLDADDLMHPQRLEHSKAVLDRRPDCAFVVTGALPFSGSAPSVGPFSAGEAEAALIGPRRLTESLARYFALMRLSWVDRRTKTVPWYAWGSFGLHAKYQASSGTLTARRDRVAAMTWPTPKAFIFTPYEDFEYCLLLHAATAGGYQIDLPLVYYRKGSSSNAPSELV